MHRLIKLLNKKGHTLTLIIGSVIVSTWTIARFVSQRADFDLIGQQLLVRQWLSGSHEFAWIGITHYIAKMFTIYMPLELAPGNPLMKLIIITLIVNIATFVLLFVLLKKILTLFNVETGIIFYVLTVWLASMAGSVFWIQYLNSRNLEVAGGLLLIFLTLKYLKIATKHYLNKEILLIFLVTFFLVAADRLQLFMTVVPIILLTSASMLWTRKKLDLKVQLIVSFMISSLLALGLIQLTASILNLHFVEPVHFDIFQSVRILGHAIVEAVRGFVTELNGGFDLYKLHRIVNILVAGIVLLCGFYILAIKRSVRTPILLGLTYIFLNILVYVISGQSLKEDTSRYLIMTAPTVVFVAAASIPYANTKIRKCLLVILVIASLFNVGAAVNIIYSKQQVSKTQQHELRQLTNDLQNSGYTYAYASMNTALPGNYFAKPSVSLLPLSCDNGVLNPSFLFFDRSVHRQVVTNQKGKLTPVVFDGDFIKNYPAVCTQESLIAQIGSPSEIKRINGNLVLLYTPKSLEKLYGSKKLQ